MRIYTTKGRVLGDRCHIDHGGNRRLYAPSLGRPVRETDYVSCGGCGTFLAADEVAHYSDRRSAIAADDYRATWPQDTAAAVLAGERR